MKIIDLFNSSTKELEDNNIETAKLDAKILLSFLLEIEANELILHFEKKVNNDFVNNFNLLLSRRLNREPIANIINKKNFWDYEFFVDENVLTPRNDSEILIEAILENFKNTEEELNILDLGTGSGCLILTTLKLYQNSKGLAVDINEKSLKIAKKNAENLNIKNITFKQNNWNDNIEEKFDIIISNPPYIPSEEIKILTPEVNKFNPMIALDGGLDGLDCYKFLAENLKKNIKNNTKIFLEIGINQENDIEKIFVKNNYTLLKIYKDLAGINRIMLFEFDSI